MSMPGLNQWRAETGDGSSLLTHREGLRNVSTRWAVTHDLAEGKDEIAWMSLYFSLGGACNPSEGSQTKPRKLWRTPDPTKN